jgi:hypothetical protein
MPSFSYQHWSTARAASLNEIESAHRRVGGRGPGRRYATQQINQAYAVLLSSQFQGFCRDLHTECADHLVRSVSPIALRVALTSEFRFGRSLDRGNPNEGNIGSDFARLGVKFWNHVDAQDSRNLQRRGLLKELNGWRNAIAHQDFDPSRLGATITLRLERVLSWRKACGGLAISIDEVMRSHIELIVGTTPW